MSVYSGFATRQQQLKYNNTLEIVLSYLTKRIVKIFSGESCDDLKFTEKLCLLHDRMYAMEQSKYMQPHFSYLVRQMLSEIMKSSSGVRPNKSEIFLEHQNVASKSGSPQIKCNTIQHLDQEFQDVFDRSSESKHSLVTIEGLKHKFRSRIKSTNLDNNVNLHFFTPQKTNSKMKSENENLARKEQSNIKDHRVIKTTTMQGFRIPKIQKGVILDNSREKLSPREFLRQTIMGRQSTNTLLDLRTKQKKKRMIKI